MEAAMAVLAAAVASVFALDLGRSALRRPRLHAQVWATAMGFYALATWALAAGLAFGWSIPLFRTFYYFGAIANIPLLAAGSVALVAGDQRGRRFLLAVGIFLALGAVATLAGSVTESLPVERIPEGSELFAFGIEGGGMTLPGPRVFAIIAGSVGTVIIVGLSLVTAVRVWRSNPQLARGNLLIILGTLAPALGGSLTALGEGGGLAFSLLVGATLLYAGYRMAISGRRSNVVTA